MVIKFLTPQLLTPHTLRDFIKSQTLGKLTSCEGYLVEFYSDTKVHSLTLTPQSSSLTPHPLPINPYPSPLNPHNSLF